jgi:dTDP-4-amino-4,6-dideoxygalactose transaminase
MIPLFKVFCPDGLGPYLEEVFQSGFVTEGEYSDKFEQMFAEFIGNHYCSLTNNCTAALTLAYRLCGLTPDDEVISTPMTCSATNEPIMVFGSKIVWADIDPTTGNICPESVKQRISSKTKAIAAVHWAGQPFDLEAVGQIAQEHGIKIVEDCAHALGSTFNGKKIGTHGNYSCFSFQAIKHLTTADGGAITCDCEEDDHRIKLLRWYGLDRRYPGNKWEQDIAESGYKFHMNNVNAAIGIKQMNHVEGIIRRHQENGKYYDQHIDNSRVQKIRRDSRAESAQWIYSLLVDDQDAFKTHMREQGVATDVVHVRNDRYSAFKAFARDDLPGVKEFCDHMMNIPVGWWVSDEDRQKVVEAVNSF